MAKILQYKRPATSDEKLAELILYVLNEMGAMSHEKLCNILWIIDSRAYMMTGKSITGCTYIKE